MPPGCCFLLGPAANFQLIAIIWTPQPAERISGCTCTHKYIKNASTPPPALLTAELQPEPSPPCSARAFSPRGESWGPRGTRWPWSHPSARPGSTARAQGSRLPPGDELQSNKPRSSQQQRFMPAINQETQTALFPAAPAESEADMGARGSWGLMGGPGQGGSAGHLCTCLPKAAHSEKFKSQNPKSARRSWGGLGAASRGGFGRGVAGEVLPSAHLFDL